MARKSRNPSYEQMLDALRAHSFDVTPYAAVASGVLVSKYGAAAVLVPVAQRTAVEQNIAASDHRTDVAGPVVAIAEHPGILVRGEVARLLDRGYQKFIKTSKYELPASASQLEAIHHFSEEMTKLIGGTSLYNESLGTTSDVYEYDRLQGREEEQPAPQRPWELGPGH